MKYLVLKWHYNGGIEFGKVQKVNPTKVVEKLQREKAKEGRPTGVTWTVIEGNIVDCLVTRL